MVHAEATASFLSIPRISYKLCAIFNYNNIEVNSENVHKGIALLWLAKRLGIKKEEIMAFGDGSNDLKMICDAGIGVAMANGIESVKAAADLIAKSNDEDGVAQIIDQYVLNGSFEK